MSTFQNFICSQCGKEYNMGDMCAITTEKIICKDCYNKKIVKVKTKKKLRDLTLEEYKDWKEGNDCWCYGSGIVSNKCFKCPLKNVTCSPNHSLCWIYHKEEYSDKFLDQEIEKPKPQFTELEKDILRNLDGIKDYKYIARHENNILLVFKNKPIKLDGYWYDCHNYGKTIPFTNLFKSIKWEDKEPYLIEDLLKEK